MLIDHGLPKAAENLFRNVTQSNRQDAGAWEGLGDAAFANGEYSAAQDAYRSSLAIDPGNPAIAKQADLCERILAFDPDMPGLGVASATAELKILAGVTDELTRCGGGGDNVAMEQARTELARKKRPSSYSDAADSNRILALELWAARPASCAAGGGDDALSRVMAKLATRD